MAIDWNIGLSSWIIQDGNYPDFACGEEVGFALEFYAEAGLHRAERIRKVAPLRDYSYRISAEVIHVSMDWWVIDFGLIAYREEPAPKGIGVGDFIEGEIVLGVDPFFYFESLGKSADAPPLIYSWQIISIARQTAPFIQVSDGFWRPLLVRDPSKLGWESIPNTAVRTDNGGGEEYMLGCRLRDVPPKRPGR